MKSMTIFQFMRLEFNQINIMILNLNTTFSSYDFILKFKEKFPEKYLKFLNTYSGNKPMKVHNQIARFLSKNETELKISKTPFKVPITNVNGKKSYVQEWAKD